MSGSPVQKRFFFSFSIRAKLLLINVTLLLGVAAYAIYENNSAKHLSSLEHASTENLSSSIDLLMLRRHEKDYLARRSEKYLTSFDNTYSQLQQRIDHLSDVLASESIAIDDQRQQIVTTLSQYQTQFHQLAAQLASMTRCKVSYLLHAACSKPMYSVLMMESLPRSFCSCLTTI